MSNRTIKFRGVEFFGKKFVYGQTIRETDDGFDMWDGEDWIHCTDLTQLVGFDREGAEVYEGDTVCDKHGIYYVVRLIPQVPVAKMTVKEAKT